MLLFAAATLTPCILIVLGAGLGGVWAWAGTAYMAVLVAVMDRLMAATSANSDPEAEFPAAVPLLILLGLLHFLLLGAVLWAVAGDSSLSPFAKLGLAIGAGLVFGQISHPVAHELVHQPSRACRVLSKLIYSSLIYGHHASAHVLIHHIHVGTHNDPSTAPRGENFYRFAMRASPQSFRAGLKAESLRLKRAGKPAWAHPYILYVGGAVLTLALATLWFGIGGGLLMVALGLHAQLQILMSDYVQHYGLRRIKRADGRLEPIGPQHSWNAPQVLSAAVMVNAPRHSDHHVKPNRTYPALQLDRDQMPYLPYSLPVMGAIALVPRLWFRVMNPLVVNWHGPADPGR